MNNLGKILLLSVATSVMSAAGALAAIPQRDIENSRPADAAEPLQLAQAGDVFVYYDGRGRRVLVDRWTGEIISIERPRVQEDGRRARREWLRERARAQQEGQRWLLETPDEMRAERRREFQERDFPLEQRDFPLAQRDYPLDGNDDGGYDDGGYAEAPDEGFAPRDWNDDGAPEMAGRGENGRVIIVRPGRVDRRSLPPVAEPGDEQDIVVVPRERDLNADSQDQDIAGLEGPNSDTTLLPAPGDESSSADTGPLIVDPQVPPPSIEPSAPAGARKEVAELQILLDRSGVSPGVIDGRFGGNLDKALAAYASVTGTVLRSTDSEGIKAALEAGGPAFVDYTITPEDAAGPYVASVPADYGDKAKLERLSYTSVPEMLAERFHMDEGYLKALNPEANFNRPGTIIRVANVGSAVTTEVTRIIADKSKKQVRAYGADGRMVAAYPATIGSSETPSPSGPHAVARIAFDPEYTYNPKVNFQQGSNTKVLTIPPGPNGPVGSIWIALDRPTYGIHGTPEPSKIGKAESHGCVRLTNWDAQELAKLVKPGVVVDFIE
ncbi:MAG: L,D-transpeptidase family protein [Rhizobiaceae bacterium]